MRTLLAIGVASMVICPAASAAIPVDVRIEGAARTVFEGPVASDVRQVQASSDGALRTCDGTNNGANPTAGPTATTVAADALGLQGQSFDGTWYQGYEDYLISRLGPESSNGWGVYRNEQRSGLGGCQVAARAGDRILWAAGTGGGTTGVLRIALTGANPYTATVTDQTGAPVAGATILDANAGGALASTGSVTGAAGTTTVPLGAGYHRLKAGKAGYVRSARAVVCVQPCGAPPADVVRRTVPPVGTTGVRVSRAVFPRTGYRRGLIVVDWRLTRTGVGMRSWKLASDDLSTRTRSYRTRARGSTATSSALRLPGGRAYALRLSWTDRLLRPGQAELGRVLVPIDDRAKAVKRSGPWRKLRSSKAWKGTVLRGRRGARLRVRLAAGRPALVLRGRGRATMRIGSKRVRVQGGRTALGAKRRKGGSVTITVMRGSIDLDGVAASP